MENLTEEQKFEASRQVVERWQKEYNENCLSYTNEEYTTEQIKQHIKTADYWDRALNGGVSRKEEEEFGFDHRRHNTWLNALCGIKPNQ